MNLIAFLSSVMLILAVVFLFHLTPEQTTADILKFINPKQTLRDKSRIAHGKKKVRKLASALFYMRDALTATGKGNRFALVCSLSAALMITGCVVSILIDNLFLLPVISSAFALAPFLYVKKSLSHYERHIETELETALSIITTSYIRSDDILSAVRENVTYLKPPVRGLFEAFLGDTTAIRSNICVSLSVLKGKVENDIFREWCDALIQCQSDRILKDTLLPIVNKLTDVRIVNNELKTMLYEPRKEFYMMVMLLIGNIPLLYILNHDWFATLVGSVHGKLALGISGMAILITSLLMGRYTKPITYKR